MQLTEQQFKKCKREVYFLHGIMDKDNPNVFYIVKMPINLN